MWLNPDSALCHLDRLVAAARALAGNHADADDLVQEVYLTLLRRPRRLTRGSELAYLMTMLRNALIDRHRTNARRQATALHEAEEPEDPRAGLRPDRMLEQRELIVGQKKVHASAPAARSRGWPRLRSAMRLRWELRNAPRSSTVVSSSRQRA